MSLSLYKPLPSLPIELKRDILRFCDPSTLAKTSVVSLAFLELSSPLLYRDITIVGLPALEKLFCTRDDSHQPQLDPFVNLRSLVRTLDFFLTNPGGEITQKVLLSSDRIPHHRRLRLDRLVVRIAAEEEDDEDDEEEEEDDESESFWRDFVRLFNPTSVVVVGVPDPQTEPSADIRMPVIDLEHAFWYQLEEITLVQSSPVQLLVETPLVGLGIQEARQRSGTEGRRMRVTFDAGDWAWERVVAFAALEDVSPDKVEDCLLAWEWVDVVLRLPKWSGMEMVEFWSQLDEGWNQLELSDDSKQSWKSRLFVEVFDASSAISY